MNLRIKAGHAPLRTATSTQSRDHKHLGLDVSSESDGGLEDNISLSAINPSRKKNECH